LVSGEGGIARYRLNARIGDDGRLTRIAIIPAG